ncbi:MAG: hypothetical protein FJW32_11140 [Acidobacteria bacterium]|nr:hypothetical protein [Acidobacteriota bacterium]
MHSLDFEVVHQYGSLAAGIEVPVKLEVGDRRFAVNAKLDTGAAFCIFDRSHAEMLGLDIEAGQLMSFRTAAGHFRAYGHEVNLKTLGVEVSRMVYFAENPEFKGNYLGRTGWLDRVRLGIVDYEQRLYLSAYDE